MYRCFKSIKGSLIRKIYLSKPQLEHPDFFSTELKKNQINKHSIIFPLSWILLRDPIWQGRRENMAGMSGTRNFIHPWYFICLGANQSFRGFSEQVVGAHQGQADSQERWKHGVLDQWCWSMNSHVTTSRPIKAMWSLSVVVRWNFWSFWYVGYFQSSSAVRKLRLRQTTIFWWLM